MMLILWLSSDRFGPAETGALLMPLLRWLFPGATGEGLDLIHVAARKLGHLATYAVLALLWDRAFIRGRGLTADRSAWLAGAIAVAWAGVDESRQTLTVTRTASVADVLLDAVGAGTALAAARLGPGSVSLVASVGLWTAAVGGVLFIALHAVLGVGSGWLWVTTPAAWLLLWLRHRGTGRSLWHVLDRPFRRSD
jgi:hypothetical protein